MTAKFNAQLVYLVPLLMSVVFGFGCAYPLPAHPLASINIIPFTRTYLQRPLATPSTLLFSSPQALLFLYFAQKEKP
jgi:hypothetical protein